MPTFFRRLKSVVAALMLGAAVAPPALAQDEARAASTMVVLDSSGSMVNDDAGGQTRIDAAKDAARTFINDVGDAADLGLVTYGGNTGETPAEQEAGCRDITLVTAPGPDTADQMLDHIDSLEPRGYTPIGDSLTQAADALPDPGGTIVLVSDGIDTCAPPPVCEVAADLADRGVDIIINTVGFNVDTAARDELQCIANAAGGTYADASDADTLAEELKRATTRNYRAYQSDLERIDGAETAARDELQCIANAAGGTYADASDADTLAEELKRATTRNYRAYQSDLERIDGAETAEASPLIPRDTTQFLTTLHPLPADAHGPTNEVPTYFRLPVEDGEYYVVSAQSVLAPQVNTRATDSLYINAELVERDDLDTRYRCTGDGYESAHDGVNGIVTGTVYSRTIGQDCNTDELMLLLKRRGDWRQTEPIDVEVTVTRIDPFTLPDGRDAEPAAEADPALTVSPSTDTPAATTPGVWFSDAVDLTPGETVAVDIVAGETQFFRVPADYGQQVLGQLQVRDDAQNWDAYTHERRLELTAYNEARAELPLTEDVIFPEPEAVLDFGYTDPIFFQNRYEGTNRGFDARKLWQDGDQYLTVRYGDTTQGTINAASQLPPITYHLTLEVEGQPQPGPTFHPVDGRSEEETTTAEPTAEVDPDVTAQEAEDNGGGMGLWLGIGAVVLVLLGAGGFALSRRS